MGSRQSWRVGVNGHPILLRVDRGRVPHAALLWATRELGREIHLGLKAVHVRELKILQKSQGEVGLSSCHPRSM